MKIRLDLVITFLYTNILHADLSLAQHSLVIWQEKLSPNVEHIDTIGSAMAHIYACDDVTFPIPLRKSTNTPTKYGVASLHMP